MGAMQHHGRIAQGDIKCMGRSIWDFSKDELRNYSWKEVSMIYQAAMNSLNPVITVQDHLVEVFRQHMDVQVDEARENALNLLSSVGLSRSRASSYPHELSGEKHQRAVIAMALALSPKLLIADEPTSALDVVTQKQILKLIRKEVKQRDLSLIFITHEILLLVGLVDNIVVMYKEQVVEWAPADKLLSEPLHPYTETLLKTTLTKDSVPIASVASEHQIDVEAQDPVSDACKFSHLCVYAFDRCTRDRPVLRQVKPGRWVSCHKY